MTQEELQAALEKAQESIKKLEAKNAEIIGKLQSKSQELEDAEAAREAAAEEAERKAGDLAALEKRLNDKWQKKYDALLAERDTLAGDVRTFHVDNVIANGLASGNVLPHMVKPLTAMLKAETLYENGTATIEGKPLTDYIKNFLSSKDGAHYVRPPESTGSGSIGSSGAKAHAFTRENIIGEKAQEFLTFSKENPTEAQAIMKSYGL